ncbi:MAG: DUF6379 domain-containing protein [Lachnospiraceae bacterium]|jgi:hypothetical protein|nr:DUF6379 domain-containing protein [Lachnospiraceae bacterium]
MAAFQSYNKLLLGGGGNIANIKAGDAVIGYEFGVYYPSYRGTFLSCIESFAVYVDGGRVPDGDIIFKLNGKECLLSQLPELYLEYWFILDEARIFVLKDGGLQGGGHDVRVEMRHRIPYTGYFGSYMVLDSADERVLAAG